MPSTGIGVYSADLVENDEVSSTYEGRHLTFLEAEITGHEHTWPTKGHPAVVGEHIVGMILAIKRTDGSIGAAANAVTDYVTIDTEGIWACNVYATDEDGNNAVVAGDELFIHKTTALISKNNNKNTHTRFGYALGGVPAGVTPYVIAVKVHWCDDDEEELVGQADALFVNVDASHRFREYHYEAQGGSYPHGDHLELTVSTVSCNSAQALVRKLLWTADDNWITGYAAVGEFELVVTGGVGTMDTICTLHLTSNIGVLTTTGHTNYAASWIYIQEYSAENEMINNLFQIDDTGATYPVANDNSNLFVATSGDKTPTHALRFISNGVNYWILCCTTN